MIEHVPLQLFVCLLDSRGLLVLQPLFLALPLQLIFILLAIVLMVACIGLFFFLFTLLLEFLGGCSLLLKVHE